MSTEIAITRPALEIISDPKRERPHSTIGKRAKLSTYRRKPPITLPKITILEETAP